MVNPGFHDELFAKLQILQGALGSRVRKYGKQAAEEWLVGHTPTELVEKRAAEIKAMLEAWDAPSPPTPPYRGNPDNEKLPLQKQSGCVRSPKRPGLTTPSPSDADRETPVLRNAAPVTQRKRRSSDELEDARPAKIIRAMIKPTPTAVTVNVPPTDPSRLTEQPRRSARLAARQPRFVSGRGLGLNATAKTNRQGNG